LDGIYMNYANIKLNSPLLFGPFGVVNRKVTRLDLSASLATLGLAYLNTNCDFFYHGWFADGTLTSSEYAVLNNFVSGGKILIMNCDDTNHDDGCNYFGRTLRQNANPPYHPSVQGAADYLFNGPFGILTTAGSYTGYALTSAFTVVSGTTGLAVDSTGNTTVLKQPVGSGFILFIGDVDLISDNAVTPTNAIQSNNDILMANMFSMPLPGAPVTTTALPTTASATTTATATSATSTSGAATSVGTSATATSAPTSAAATSAPTSAAATSNVATISVATSVGTSAGTSAGSTSVGTSSTQVFTATSNSGTQGSSTEASTSSSSTLSVSFGVISVVLLALFRSL